MELSKRLDEILEEMLDDMTDGGMDTSYGGTNYHSAKKKAIAEIVELINNKQYDKQRCIKVNSARK